jgi:hypothetical protein
MPGAERALLRTAGTMTEAIVERAYMRNGPPVLFPEAEGAIDVDGT